MNDNKLSRGEKIAVGILILVFMGCISLLFEGVQFVIISIVEKLVFNRKLNNPLNAQRLLIYYSFFGMAICSVLGIIILLLSQKTKLDDVLDKIADRKCLGISIKNIIIECPFMTISFIFVLYLVKNIFLVANIAGLNTVVLLLSIPIHIGIIFVIYRKKSINSLSCLAICYGILVLSVLISITIFDHSWDGQTYHQLAVMHLKDGWNPFYWNLPETGMFVWNNHYPKFTELFASIFSDVSNNIEAGKSYNVIFFVITLCYALKYAANYHKNKLAVLTVSILFVMNPVVLSQFFTYYVDGLMGMLIIILFFACIDYDKRNDIRDIIVIIAVSIFAINTKTTGFICGIVLISYIIRQFAIRKYKQMRVLIVSGIIILAVGVLFTGYNPYITNFRYYGHPFYPLYGNNKVDIIYNGNIPKNLVSWHPVKRFFSLFLLNYDIDSIPFNPFKIFSLDSHYVYDLRVAGFGLFLTEIFVFISLIVLFSIKNDSGRYKAVLFPAMLLLFISLIIPENWWARYIPFFWYFFAFFIMVSDYSVRKNRNLFFILSIIVIINSIFFFVSNARNGILYTRSFKRFITDVKKSDSDTINVVVNYEYFKYAVTEKMMFYDIEKNIIFVEDRETSFNNGLVMGCIRGWY
jgi:hypothetical protein